VVVVLSTSIAFSSFTLTVTVWDVLGPVVAFFGLNFPLKVNSFLP
jgi:hypothetical protein